MKIYLILETVESTVSVKEKELGHISAENEKEALVTAKLLYPQMGGYLSVKEVSRTSIKRLIEDYERKASILKILL